MCHIRSTAASGRSVDVCGGERDFFIDNLLVRIHFIIVMIRWTGLAPWGFEFPFPGSLTYTFPVLWRIESIRCFPLDLPDMLDHSVTYSIFLSARYPCKGPKGPMRKSLVIGGSKSLG